MDKETFLRHVRNLNAKWDRRVKKACTRKLEDGVEDRVMERRAMRSEHLLEMKALISEYAHEHGDAALMRRRVKVMEMKRRGRSFRQIASKLGLSYRTVQRDWEKCQLERGIVPAITPHVYRRISQEDQQEKLEKVRDLRSQGHTFRQISKKLGIRQSTVARYVKMIKTGKSP